MVAEIFQMYSVKIIANTFLSQKIESVHFCSCFQTKLSPRFLSLSFRQTRIGISPKQIFLKIFFPEEKEGERLMELKKLPKLTKLRYR